MSDVEINPLQDHLTQTHDDILLAAPQDNIPPEETPAKAHIPRAVRFLGIMMMLMNCAFVMTFSFSGIYLKSLGMPNVHIGLVEGFAEAISHVMKLVSGILSDVFKSRKPVMYVGYALSVLSRPLMASAGTFMPFFAAKTMERIGNGIQGAPRDAIVADITPFPCIGAAYGLKRSLATIGSILGAILGIVVMHLTNNNMQAVFWYACIPAFMAFGLLVFCVHEPRRMDHSAVSAEVPLPPTKGRHRIAMKKLKLLGNSFWLLMLVNAIFMLARMSEQFIILHAKTNYGLSTAYAPMIMMIFNFGWCLTSYPVGLIADRVNRYWILVLGIILLVLAGIILSTAANLGILTLGVLCWGFQYGITMNIFSSLIAETVPENLRGTGFAIYYGIMAVSTFTAEALSGKIADVYGYHSSFIMSAIIGLCSLILLTIIMALKSSQRSALKKGGF